MIGKMAAPNVGAHVPDANGIENQTEHSLRLTPLLDLFGKVEKMNIAWIPYVDQ
jgi:hypothetical protein